VKAVRDISNLLSLNREVNLALIQEDNIQKAVDKIRQQKSLIIRA
jgi:hypothetical protein